MASLLFVGTCTNIYEYIPRLKPQFAAILALYPASKFLFAECGSSDQTVAALTEWSKEEDRVAFTTIDVRDLKTVVGRTTANEPCPMEVVAYKLNALFDFMDASYSSDYIVLLDLQEQHTLPVNELHKVISGASGAGADFDAVCAYKEEDETGNLTNTYHFRCEEYPFGAEVLSHYFWKKSHQTALQDHVKRQPPVFRVLSAFCGMCIFRSKSIEGLRFSSMPTHYLDLLCRSRANELVIPSVETLYDMPLGRRLFPNKVIFYYNNDGINCPVVSPYATFFLAMYERKKTNIFMSKRLKLGR